MNEEIKRVVEDFNKTIADFEARNEARLREIEAKGHEDPLLKAEVQRIAEDVAKLASIKSQLESLEDAVARMQAPPAGGDAEKPVYASIGDQLKDVALVGTPGAPRGEVSAAYERLNRIAAASGASEGIPSDGGFLVGTDRAAMLDRGTVATGLLSSRCFNVPCGSTSNGLELQLVDESSRANGSRFGGIQVYMRSEADTVTATKPKFRQAEWKLKDCMGIMYATNDLLRDSAQLTAVVNRWFPAEFGFKVDDQIVNGTGAGQALGIVNAGCTVSQSIETGQVRATTPILYENVVKMYSRLLSSSDASAVWFVNRALLPYIMLMTIPVGTGGAPVFLPPNGAAGQPYMTLLNKPIIPIEQCAAPGSVGDIILADLNEYLLLTKGGIEAQASIHVRFLYDEMTFRWTYRFDGAPIRNKVLTPYKGSATQGPFVVLAAS